MIFLAQRQVPERDSAAWPPGHGSLHTGCHVGQWLVEREPHAFEWRLLSLTGTRDPHDVIVTPPASQCVCQEWTVPERSRGINKPPGFHHPLLPPNKHDFRIKISGTHSRTSSLWIWCLLEQKVGTGNPVPCWAPRAPGPELAHWVALGHLLNLSERPVFSKRKWE